MIPTQLSDQQSAQLKFIAVVKKWSWIVLILVSIIQLIFFFSIELFFALSSVFLAWLLTTSIFLKPSILNRFPLSTWLILGFCGTQLYFPVLFTTLEGKSLLYNLEYPEEVFLHSLLGLLVLIIAHATYRFLKRKRSNPNSFSFTAKIGLFDPPSPTQLWIMGLIGLGGAVYTYFRGDSAMVETVTGDPVDKFIQGLMPFSYAPYFLLSYTLYGGKKPNIRRATPFLIAFTILLFAVSIARNSRAAFMFGFTSLAFSYVVGLLLGIYENKLFSVKNFFVAALVGWLLTGPVADIGTAMVIVRGDRSEMPAIDLLSQTMDTFADKDAIRARREEDSKEYTNDGWDERYLDNLFTARFANVKFNDLSLIQYHRLSDYDPDMLEYSKNYVIGGLPNFAIQLFGFDVDKEVVYGMSFGDFIYLLAGGKGASKGFRLGHYVGTGMIAFSWWYLALFGLGMVVIFYMFDKLFKPSPFKINGQESDVGFFSVCGLLAMTSIFQFIFTESIAIYATFIYRQYFEMLFLYLIILKFGKVVEGVFTFGSKTKRHQLT